MHKDVKFTLSPIFSDFKQSAGSADGHYFWQDLIVAQKIFNLNPKVHLDVGSRVDGFVAHLLTFREVHSLDIRELHSQIPGLTFIQGDAQEPLLDFEKTFDSVSSLHSIEHFGLGRYGDSLQYDGHIRGLKNIAACVKIGGILYVSFPIGEERIEFNAQRIVHPSFPTVTLENFCLLEFILIPWKGSPIYSCTPEKVDLSIKGQAGIYVFERIS
jgi:SAM-dependent methyltransferase